MRVVLAIVAVFALATSAMAHRLNVFAYVAEDTVIVEAKFSTGKIPVSGEVRILNAQSELVATLALNADGTVQFPLADGVGDGGLTIEVSTSEGHDDYWILTPDDIAKGSGS